MMILRDDLLLLTTAFLCGASAGVEIPDGMMDQFKYYRYFDEPFRYHSDWIRWNATDATVIGHERVIRSFVPGVDGKSAIQHNTHMYDDDRGNVVRGPWIVNKTTEAMTPYGLIFSGSDTSRLFFFPDGSAAWILKELPRGTSPFTAFECSLGYGGILRVAIVLVYDEAGKLSRLTGIRGDSRDFDLFWSTSKDDDGGNNTLLKHTSREEREHVLKDFWAPSNDVTNTAFTSFKVAVPGPVESITQGLKDTDLESMKMNPKALLDQDEVFELPNGIFVVCPSQLPTDDGGDFVFSLGWKKHDGSWTSSNEVRYSAFTLSELVYTRYNSSQDSSFSKDDGSGSRAEDNDASAASSIFLNHYCMILATALSAAAIASLAGFA